MDLEKILQAINHFVDERDWKQFHNEKDLALSISLEASELLEIYQWKTPEEANQNIEAIQDEVADVMIYTLMLANNLNLDLEDIILKKIKKNERKYPV